MILDMAHITIKLIETIANPIDIDILYPPIANALSLHINFDF